MQKKLPKNLVITKKLRKIWWVQKNCVPLHRKSENGGSVAQLNRASDYGSEGCGFESRRNHEERYFEYHSLFCYLLTTICAIF